MGSLVLDPRSGQRTHAETVAAGATTAPVLLPSGMSVTAAVVPSGGGTARIEYSLDPHDDVVAGAATVQWIAWTQGDVSVAAMDSQQGPISAIRATAATAPAEFRVIV